MKFSRLSIVLAAASLMLGLVLVGCEDDEIVTPTDGVIAMYASPGTISINEAGGQQIGSSLVTATLVDTNGRTVEGATLSFRTSAGWICPVTDPSCYVCPDTEPDCANGKAPVNATTNVTGEASALAIVSYTVPGSEVTEVSVTAQSAALFGTATLTREIISEDPNQPPNAAIQMDPQKPVSDSDAAQVEESILFNGSISSDPDGDLITCYQWDVISTVSADDEFLQGPTLSAFNRTYLEEQVLDIVLRVTDKPGAADGCVEFTGHPSAIPSGTRLGLEWFYGESVAQVGDYPIVCANEPPIAEAGANKSVPITGTSVFVELDGGESYDPDGKIERYAWQCGGANNPIPGSVPWRVTCRYPAAEQDYIATLTVYDNGDGTGSDPNTGRPRCEKNGTDTVTVSVFRP